MLAVAVPPPAVIPPGALIAIVSVWLVPTAFVAVAGVIEIDASTQFFVALGPSLCWLSPVVRVRLTPPTLTVVVALTMVVPTVADVSVTVHSPVVPTVTHGELLIVPGPLTLLTVTLVFAGAFTKPLPGFTFTCTVRVWMSPIGSVSVDGVMLMFAST